MSSSLPMFPTTEQVQANGGWKQCGPFYSSSSSNLVMNWNTDQQRHYAVRAQRARQHLRQLVHRPEPTGRPAPGRRHPRHR
jgi:hypothetical protein